MTHEERERLRAIRTIPSLVKYLPAEPATAGLEAAEGEPEYGESPKMK
jgi:hypothetical protein